MNLTEQKLRVLIRNVLIEHDMSLDTLVKPKVTDSTACGDCKGTGKYVPAFGAARDCDTCHGAGTLVKQLTPATKYTEEELRDIIKISKDDGYDSAPPIDDDADELACGWAWDSAQESISDNDMTVDDSTVEGLMNSIIEAFDMDDMDDDTKSVFRDLVRKELEDFVEWAKADEGMI